MDNRPIGIFDSGLGGLTGMKALRELLPEENVVYFADTGRVPYGEKTRAQLRHMAVQDLELVGSCGVKAVLVACGTLSSNVPELLDSWPVPAVGVLKSSVAVMADASGEGPLGIIATEASIRSGAFERALRTACPDRQILAVACPDFVPLIESGHLSAGDPLVQQAVERHLQPLKAAGVKRLLLGCTHYGLISPAIGAFLGEDVEQVSASHCAAAAMARLLQERGLTGGEGRERFLTSGRAADFAAAASTFLGRPIHGRVEEVPVMEVTPHA